MPEPKPSKNLEVYSTDRGVKNLAKRVNTCGIEKSHKRGLVNKSKSRAICTEQSQDVNNVFYANRFSVFGRQKRSVTLLLIVILVFLQRSVTKMNIKASVSVLTLNAFMKVSLFGVLRRFQHCTGHITTGSWKGRGNQYI